MTHNALVLTVVLCTASLLAGCARPTATPPAPTSAPSPAAIQARPTFLPATAPTAAPLATLVPLPLPSATPAKSVKATPVPTSQEKLGTSTAAVVNGIAISKAEYDRQINQAQVYFLKQPGLDIQSDAGKQALQRLRNQVLDWMIDQVLIAQAAAARGQSVSEQQIEAEIARMKSGNQAAFDNWLASNGLTLESLRQQLRMDLISAAMRDAVTTSLPRRMPQIHVRHILTSEESAAQGAWKQLKQGQNFIALARQVSEDEATRSTGGDLGFLPRGVMPPTFEEVAFSLKPGEVSDVVRSEFGFHIIQVVESDPAHEVSDELWPMVQQHAFDDWLADQRAKARISINAELSKS